MLTFQKKCDKISAEWCKTKKNKNYDKENVKWLTNIKSKKRYAK